jgi:hypothetical protein
VKKKSCSEAGEFQLLSVFAEAQVYPVGGFGDAWIQNPPSSIGITNGYDPRAQNLLSSGQSLLRGPRKSALSGRAAMAGYKDRVRADVTGPAAEDGRSWPPGPGIS